MTELAFTRRGTGAPLLLLHPLGLSRRAWDPVLPALSSRFDVIAVDLPGHGDSPSLSGAGSDATPAGLAASVAGFLDRRNITAPHVAGDSIGGWIALELARLRPVASLALLSPAGLWRGGTPLYPRLSLHGTHRLVSRATNLLERLVSYRLGRVLALAQTHGRPARVDPGYARMEIRTFATCPGFKAIMKATKPLHYSAGSGAAVSVAFGTRDFLLLPGQSRHYEQLPPASRIGSLPRCGHVPMPDDPEAVAAFIIEACSVRL
jgi:pimeloyl-ACP methyl ester carboxylesterase